MSGLGRRTPTDFAHVEKYPLTAMEVIPQDVPVAIGINWYDNFDAPVAYADDAQSYKWIGLDKENLGNVRGGHCVCLLPKGMPDRASWYTFYNQGQEGACVGFGCSRMMSLLNRKEYDAWWLWERAKMVDEWDDTNPGDANGTSVRAACDILRKQGHVPIRKGRSGVVAKADGIKTNRWATDVDQILHALGTPTWDHVRILNSWGEDYPRVTRMPAETLQRLLDEDGEACLVTDR